MLIAYLLQGTCWKSSVVASMHGKAGLRVNGNTIMRYSLKILRSFLKKSIEFIDISE
jgi:hypothetical protein